MRVLCTEEACVLVPYPDGPHLSVGFGHNDARLKLTDPPITVKRAIEMLREDLKSREADINRMLRFDAGARGQRVFDALLDAYYNKGNQVRPVIELFNRGQETDAIEHLRTINKNAAGEYKAGLARRREREIGIWLHGDYGDISTMKLWRGDPHKTRPEIIPFPEGF